jgi:hypothetical protein
VFTDEMRQLASGLLMSLSNNAKVMVFAYCYGILGDIPARKQFFGLSSVVFNGHPCPNCNILLDDIKRSLQEDEELLRCFNFTNVTRDKTIAPADDQFFQFFGVKYIAAVTLWPGQANFDSCLIDIMHLGYLGLWFKYFLAFMEKLRKPALWGSLNDEYKQYCIVNKMTDAYYKFQNATDFKGLKANRFKHFMEVSLHIFEKLDVYSFLHDDSAKQMYQNWITLVNLNVLLTAQVFTNARLRLIDQLISSFLTYLASDMSDLMTLNAHILVHLTRQIKLYGPPVEYWCFPSERFIKPLKRFFLNTNNRQISSAVLERFHKKMVYNLLRQATAGITNLDVPQR